MNISKEDLIKKFAVRLKKRGENKDGTNTRTV